MEIKPTSVSGDYASQGVNANSFATVWDANAKGIAPTRFSYNIDGTPVANITLISAFGVTMRVQAASKPDLLWCLSLPSIPEGLPCGVSEVESDVEQLSHPETLPLKLSLL